METSGNQVTIVGAGPVGLSLALGLARYGVRSVVFEMDDWISERSKAPGVLPRTLEIFSQWGVFESFERRGQLLPQFTLYSAEDNSERLSLDFEVVREECAVPHMCIIEQAKTEEILLEAVQNSGMCDVRFKSEVVGLQQENGRVLAELRGGETVAGDYLVGCDGASSTVRELLGLGFEGITYDAQPMLADIRLSDERDALPWPRFRLYPDSIRFALRLSPGWWRLVSLQRSDRRIKGEVDRRIVDEFARDLMGPGLYELEWSSWFQIHRRSAERFRVGRVLLAGDAGHVNSPAGGQGMNGGIQDAHNLAWKLAFALNGGDAERLLDSYNAERHEVVKDEIERNTDMLTRGVLFLPVWMRSLGFSLLDLAMKARPLEEIAVRRMAMLNMEYEDSPLLVKGEGVGDRCPNVEIGSRRLYDLMGLSPAALFVNCEPQDLPRGVVPIHIPSPPPLLVERLELEKGVALIRPDHYVGRVLEGPVGDSLSAEAEATFGLCKDPFPLA